MGEYRWPQESAVRPWEDIKAVFGDLNATLPKDQQVQQLSPHKARHTYAHCTEGKATDNCRICKVSREKYK